MFKSFWNWLKSLFGASPAPTPAPSPSPVPAPSPTIDNDANGLYLDSRVTHPQFKGYGICLKSEAAKFAATSHQAQVIVMNTNDIDAQIALSKDGSLPISVGNTCYNVDANGRSTGVQIPNSVRCPSSVSGRDAAAAYINALPVYSDPTAGSKLVP